MRIGILNVYWFGLLPENDQLQVGFYHGAEDDARVAALLRAMEVDALVLVEIVDVHRLEHLLTALPGRWRVRAATGEAVCSNPVGELPDDRQRVVIAWNEETVELVRWARPLPLTPRPPVVARLKELATSHEWTLVGIHPKSGLLRDWEALPPSHEWHKAGLRRTAYFEQLSAWLAAPPPDYAGLVVLAGDYNSVHGSSETAALRALPGWGWPTPAFVPSNAEPITTRTDPEIIDHFVLPQSVTVSEHRVIAFDVLPDFPDPEPSSERVWKRTTDHRAVRITVAQ